MKHIESILPEHAADELTQLLLDDATISLALEELLHRATGCNIPTLGDTPTSEISEMIPLCLRILRRFWNAHLTALGDGIKKQSIADLLRQTIGDRVQGNEALGISPANVDIPTAVAALRQRDMSSGLTLTLTDGTDGSTTSPTTMPLPDGLSLAQLLFGTLASQVTEIKDSNTGWGALSTFKPWTLFPNLTSLQVSCESISTRWLEDNTTLVNLSMPYLKRTTFYGGPFYNCFTPETELNFPSLERVDFGSNYTPWLRQGKMRTFTAENLLVIRSNGTRSPMFGECPNLEEIILPRLGYINHYDITTKNGGIAYDCPKLWKVQLGDLNDAQGYGYGTENAIGFPDCPNLIHLEIGCNGLVAKSVDARWWSPTTALSERLDEFLSNFQTYIADRVEDRTGTIALTLTLSAAVYEALQAQEGQTILATLTNKNWTVAQA